MNESQHIKKYSPRLIAAVICFCVFSSLSSQAAYAQDFYANSDSGNGGN